MQLYKEWVEKEGLQMIVWEMREKVKPRETVVINFKRG